jgi:hypothetical protein
MTAFVLSSASFFVILKRAFCTRCMNFACPLNGVSEATRQEFDAQNVYVA